MSAPGGLEARGHPAATGELSLEAGVVNFIQIFSCTSVRCCKSNRQLKAAGHLRAALSSQAASLVGPNSARVLRRLASLSRSRRQLIAHKQRKGAYQLKGA